MSSIERDIKVKVLVLGDSGVGKSTFTHLLCHNQANKSPSYTIGCSVEIKLHDFMQGTAEEQTYCIEIWDIGASKSHSSSRFIFYGNVNGIILAHDLTNYKSLQNIKKWLNDVLDNESGGLASVKVNPNCSINNSGENNDLASTCSIPIVMVGTKHDMLSNAKRYNVLSRSKLLADGLKCDEIHVDSADTKYVAAGSGNAVKLSRFFDKVVEHALLRRKTTSTVVQSPVVDRRSVFSTTDRKRLNVGSQFQRRQLLSKVGHQD